MKSRARNNQRGPEAPGKWPGKIWKDDVALLSGKEETQAVPGSGSPLCKCPGQGEVGALGSTRDGGWAGGRGEGPGETGLERRTETFTLGTRGSHSRLYTEGQI